MTIKNNDWIKSGVGVRFGYPGWISPQLKVIQDINDQRQLPRQKRTFGSGIGVLIDGTWFDSAWILPIAGAVRSCFNCKNLKTWDHPVTRDDAGDSGWDCGDRNNHELTPEEEAVADAATNEEFYAAVVAKRCPKFSIYDWNAHP